MMICMRYVWKRHRKKQADSISKKWHSISRNLKGFYHLPNGVREFLEHLTWLTIEVVSLKMCVRKWKETLVCTFISNLLSEQKKITSSMSFVKKIHIKLSIPTLYFDADKHFLQGMLMVNELRKNFAIGLDSCTGSPRTAYEIVQKISHTVRNPHCPRNIIDHKNLPEKTTLFRIITI